MTNQAVLIPLLGEYPALPLIRLQPTAVRTSPAANVGIQYRRRYTIVHAGGESLLNFPYALDLGLTNGLVSGGKALASGNDLRCWVNGREIARTLVNWNDASFTTLCWIIIPYLQPGKSMVVEIGYGNPSAGTPPTHVAGVDKPIFDVATAGANRSTNAKWIYKVQKVAANAGLGLWYLSTGTTQPVLKYTLPGSWRQTTTLDAVDDHKQESYTSYVDTGTKYLGTFQARRARSGSTVILDSYGPDGVAIHVPTAITSVRADFTWTNNSINTNDATPIGKLVILGRRVQGDNWFTVQQFNTLQETPADIAVTTYTPVANVKDLALAVWPYNEGSVDISARDDRYIDATLKQTLEVNLDTTIVTHSQTESEQTVFELANELRYGGGAYGEGPFGGYQKIILGNAAGASGIGTRRMTCKINEQVQVDNVNRRVEIWNSGLTAKVEDVPIPAYDAIEASYRGNGATTPIQTDFIEHPDPDWLTILPVANPLTNPDFGVNVSAWTVLSTTAGITHGGIVRDAAVYDSGDPDATHNGAAKIVISANTAAANAAIEVVADDYIPVGDRTAVWFGVSARTSNTNLVPRLVFRFYDVAQALIGSATTLTDPGTLASGVFFRRIGSALVPQGAVYWRVGVRWEDNAGASTGSVYWDRVRPLDVDVALYNATPGPITLSYAVQARYAYA